MGAIKIIEKSEVEVIPESFFINTSGHDETLLFATKRYDRNVINKRELCLFVISDKNENYFYTKTTKIKFLHNYNRQ